MPVLLNTTELINFCIIITAHAHNVFLQFIIIIINTIITYAMCIIIINTIITYAMCIIIINTI